MLAQVIDAPPTVSSPNLGAKHWTTDLTIRIIECVANGEFLSAIGAKIGKDRRIVGRLIKRWQQEKTLELKKGQGRKRKTSERDDSTIVISVSRNRFTTVKEIQGTLPISNVCESTIGEFSSYWAARCLSVK
jgi:hypothetical protein